MSWGNGAPTMGMGVCIAGLPTWIKDVGCVLNEVKWCESES
jgi:hypothetical protein